MNRRIPVPTPPMSRGSTAAGGGLKRMREWMQQALSMRLACEFVPRFSSKASLTSLAAALLLQRSLSRLQTSSLRRSRFRDDWHQTFVILTPLPSFPHIPNMRLHSISINHSNLSAFQ